MIQTATVAPLWGSEIQPEPRSWRETSGEHSNRRNTSRGYDSPAYCCPSLGLGNTAGDVDVNVIDVVDVEKEIIVEDLYYTGPCPLGPRGAH